MCVQRVQESIRKEIEYVVDNFDTDANGAYLHLQLNHK